MKNKKQKGQIFDPDQEPPFFSRRRIGWTIGILLFCVLMSIASVFLGEYSI